MSIHEECGVFGVIAPRSVDVDRSGLERNLQT